MPTGSTKQALSGGKYVSLHHQQTAQLTPRFVFSDRWLAEAVRLDLAQSREPASIIAAQQQLNAEQFARQQSTDPELRILHWGQQLAQTLGLPAGMQAWRQRAALMLVVMLVLAFTAGLSAAFGIMGDGSAPVNVVWALGALLGVNVLMLMLWLGSLSMSPGELSIGNLWYWLSTRVGGRDTLQLARSFVLLSSRSGISRWWMAIVTHLVWSSLAIGAFAGLLLALSLRSYVFVWETTILPASLFNTFVQGTGWLPAQLGFAMPDAGAVIAAGEPGSAWTEQVGSQRRAWAGWLCGALLVYGFLPRLLLLMVSYWQLKKGLNGFRLDIHHADWSRLSARLSPAGESAGVIDAEQPADSLAAQYRQRDQSAVGAPVIIAFELSDQIVWPAPEFSDFHHESVVTRQQRINTLALLDQSPPHALLLVCDSAQTVDRGSLSWLSHASGRALHVAVLLTGDGSDSRRQLWRQQLQTLGILSSSVFDDQRAARQWLESHA
jgi:hypothetical protein